MSNEVNAIVRVCESYERTRGTQNWNLNYMKLFPTNGSLEFIEMKLLVPVAKT